MDKNKAIDFIMSHFDECDLYAIHDGTISYLTQSIENPYIMIFLYEDSDICTDGSGGYINIEIYDNKIEIKTSYTFRSVRTPEKAIDKIYEDLAMICGLVV